MSPEYPDTGLTLGTVDLDGNDYKCAVAMTGTLDGAALTVSGIASFDPRVERDEDECGPSAAVVPGASLDEAALSVSVDGSPVPPDDPRFEAALSGPGWAAAYNAAVKACDELFLSERGSDFMADDGDSRAESKDPYGYRGLRRSDFL